ncbi:MAG TPA: class I SAM-dependent methyltransferase [Gemmatimonadaceae bacterium]|jgi:SAM-dependent methyltransferase|nr:class I SAM-dependent methyltransferase [Gemmatimonadaceae bacterium]
MTSVSLKQVYGGATPLGGELWSARAHDWAELMEPAMRQLYVAILDRLAPLAGTSLLDAGCGAGLFCRLAAARGAAVVGLDSAPALLDIARQRVPNGTFDLGDVGNLPYDDATFDVVTGINSFPYVSSPSAVLREARRVAKPGGRSQIVIAAWGRADECEAAAYLDAIEALVPSSSAIPGPFALSQPDALEAVAAEMELTPVEVVDVAVEWCFADLDDALDAMLSSGPAVRAVQLAGERRVRKTVAESIRPFGTARGEYRLENTFRYLIARA